jgi:hypothetical protein
MKVFTYFIIASVLTVAGSMASTILADDTPSVVDGR